VVEPVEEAVSLLLAFLLAWLISTGNVPRRLSRRASAWITAKKAHLVVQAVGSFALVITATWPVWQSPVFGDARDLSDYLSVTANLSVAIAIVLRRWFKIRLPLPQARVIELKQDFQDDLQTRGFECKLDEFQLEGAMFGAQETREPRHLLFEVRTRPTQPATRVAHIKISCGPGRKACSVFFRFQLRSEVMSMLREKYLDLRLGRHNHVFSGSSLRIIRLNVEELRPLLKGVLDDEAEFVRQLRDGIGAK